MTLLATARSRASEPHYRTGVQAAQRQDLDGAIAAFDRVLAINPEHRNAQLQRAQAVELKANLQRLRRTKLGSELVHQARGLPEAKSRRINRLVNPKFVL